ncbi:MAG: M56 family metallopeptidase [Bacteroidota bacterium]
MQVVSHIAEWMYSYWGQDFLISFTIKSALILTLTLLLLWRMQKMSASVKHFVGLLGFGALLLIPVLSLQPTGVSLTLYDYQLEDSQETYAKQTTDQGSTVLPKGSETKPTSNVSKSYQIQEWLLAIWMLGIALLLLTMLIEVVWLRIITMLGTSAVPKNQSLFLQAKRQIKLSRKVKLVGSDKIQVPLTFGWLKPVVLVPVQASNWSDEQLNQMFLHELAHIKRWDYFTHLMVNLCTMIFWYNPLVWWMAKRHNTTMEMACDDLVLDQKVKASAYAMQLVEIARGTTQNNRIRKRAVALSSHSGLSKRIHSILSPNQPRNILNSTKAIICIALALGLTVPLTGMRFNDISASISSSWSFEDAISQLKNEQPEQRLKAAQNLEISYNSALITPALQAMRTEESPEVLATMVKAVGKFGYNYTFYDLANYLNHPDAEVKVATLEALSAISCLPSYLLIEERLADQDQRVSAAANQAMENIKRHKLNASIKLFRKALNQGEDRRNQIVSSFRNIQHSEVIPELLETYQASHAKRLEVSDALLVILANEQYTDLRTVITQ